MAYTPTTWTTGDTITAAKMNKLENGVANAGSALICNAADVDGNYRLDKTVQEIYDALLSGTPAYIRFQYGVLGTDYVSHLYLAPIIKIYSYDTLGMIRVTASRPIVVSPKNNFNGISSPALAIFSASSLTDYPIMYANTSIPSSTLNVDASII